MQVADDLLAASRASPLNKATVKPPPFRRQLCRELELVRLQEITHMGTFKYSIDRAALMGAANDVKWSPRVGIGSGAARRFPARPGVYVFAEDVAAGVDARYVGRTGDLQRRIGDHIMYSDNDCLRNVLDNAANVKISVTVQGSRTARMNIEHTCYKHYLGNNHSLCNDAEPEGRYLGRMPLPF